MKNIDNLKPLLRNSNKQITTAWKFWKHSVVLKDKVIHYFCQKIPAHWSFLSPFQTDRMVTTCLHSNLSDLTFLLLARTLQMDATANSYYRNAVWMCLFHCRNISSENSICANIFHVLFLFFVAVNKYIFTPFVTIGINGKVHNKHIFQVKSSVIKV